jgi:transposase InsO family protein
VNTHQNARLSVWGRGELVRRVLEDGEPAALVAAALHVSPGTVYKWVRRYQAAGAAGLLDRSSRPHRSPRRTAPHVVRWIARRRTQRQTGPEIAAALRLPRATVGRVLLQLGMGRLRVPRPPIVRYERAHPGDLVHLDLKALPRFTTAGHRIHGRLSKVGRPGGLGADYLHIAIDDATRLAYAELRGAQDGPACADFLTRAGRWYAQLGIRVGEVMTDNAFAYTGKAVRAVLDGWRAGHVRTRPYTPRTNGKAERFIQTCLREWAFKKPYANSGTRGRALPNFLDFYNTSRSHSALGHIPPLLNFLERREQRV